MRFSLRAFLIGLPLLAAALGLYARNSLFAPTFDLQIQYVDGYRIEAMWRRQYGKESLVFLVAHAHIGTWSALSSQWPDDNPARKGLSRIPKGLYLDGKLADGAPEQKLFIGNPSEYCVEAVPHRGDLTFGYQDWQRLPKSKLWADSFRPRLEELRAKVTKQQDARRPFQL